MIPKLLTKKGIALSEKLLVTEEREGQAIHKDQFDKTADII